MIDSTASIEMILAEIDKARRALHAAVQPLSDEEINSVPFKDSWTAAQVIRHLTKSAKGIDRTMQSPAPVAERDPQQRISEFQKLFLDFSTKFNSPEFIVPENDWFQKEALLDSLDQSYFQLKESVADVDLGGLVKNLPMGDATKIELLHFVLYHTARHLHQLQKICDAVKTAQVTN